MIQITNERRGLDFHDWVDVFLTIPDHIILANPIMDLSEEEHRWLSFLMGYRGKTDFFMHQIECKEIPDTIKKGRGIGAWWNSQLIIVSDRIATPSRLSDFNLLWNDLPKYRRLRPFNENKRALHYFFQLTKILNPNSTYITTHFKSWANDFLNSRSILQDELHSILSHYATIEKERPQIIALGEATHYELSKISIPHHVLQHPEFYSRWVDLRWQQYFTEFNNMVKGQ